MDTDSSHSDSDDLMESQELTPGFGTEGNTEERGEDRLDLQVITQIFNTDGSEKEFALCCNVTLTFYAPHVSQKIK